MPSGGSAHRDRTPVSSQSPESRARKYLAIWMAALTLEKVMAARCDSRYLHLIRSQLDLAAPLCDSICPETYDQAVLRHTAGPWKCAALAVTASSTPECGWLSAVTTIAVVGICQ